MDLAELRKRVLARCRRSGTSFDPEEVDFAIQSALHELDLTAYHSTSVTSAATFTANNPELDVSGLTGLRPERVIRAELAYTDQSTWASGTSYAVNDLVQGDGNPDSKFYVCTAAHTASSSNEPGQSGGDAFWELRMWKRGDVVQLLDRATIGKALGDRSQFRLYLPYDYQFDTDTDARGKPRVGGFWTDALFYVYPVPDAAYKIVFLQRQAVDDWTPGTDALTTIDVPDNVLIPMVEGMCWYLDPDHKMATTWRALFERHIQKVDGASLIDAGQPMKDRQAYRDHTDQLDQVFGPWDM